MLNPSYHSYLVVCLLSRIIEPHQTWHYSDHTDPAFESLWAWVSTWYLVTFHVIFCDQPHLCNADGVPWLMYVQCNEVLANKIFYLKKAVNYWAVTAELQVRSQAISCGICFGQIGIETGYYWVLQFPPVSIIPPMLRTRILFSCLPRWNVSETLYNSLNHSPSEWSYNILIRSRPILFSFLREMCYQRLMQDTTLHKVWCRIQHNIRYGAGYNTT